MDIYQAELLLLLNAVTITSPSSFNFAGREIRAEGSPPNDLLSRLQGELYQHAYCRRFNAEDQEAPKPSPPDGGLIEPLARANTTTERWEYGWRLIRQEGNGAVWAAKGETTRLFQAGQYAVQSVDGAIAVYLTKEGRQLQPGFYHAFGDTLADALDDRLLLRLYWNVRPEGAAELLGELTTCLNAHYLPFQLKCLNSQALFPRADALVLYVARRYHRVLLPLAADCHRRVVPFLDEETPLFTRKLARGLSLADDPGDGQSFGMHRTGLLATAIWQAHAAGYQDAASRLQILANVFAQQQLDLRTPYLRAGGKDVYVFQDGEV